MPEIKLDDEKVLRMFVDKLIADKGGDTLDAKQKKTLQKELFKKLNERMQAAMVRALPDAKLMELEGLLDAGAPDEEIESFFANSGVSFDAALRQTMSEFRDAYFSGKIKTSVKLKAPTGAGDKAKKGAVPTSAQKTDVNAVQPAVGQPAQGVSSAMPGRSNVEGVANVASAAAQGQTLAAPTQTVTQGVVSGTQGTDVTSQPFQVQPGQPLPIQPLQQPIQAPPVQPQVTPAQAQARPEAEQPLQAAPDLMDALNAATAHLNMATANLSEQPAQGIVQTEQAVTQPEQMAQAVSLQQEQPAQRDMMAQNVVQQSTAQQSMQQPIQQPMQQNTNNGMTGEEA